MKILSPYLSIMVINVAAFVLFWASESVVAQPPQVRGHIRLPPVRGATALSTQIGAQAHLVAAAGSFLESAAIARRHNAIAASMEMDNMVKWVDTYFDRRQRNRSYRAIEQPAYMDRNDQIYASTRRRVVDQADDVIKGDVTRYLNWFLNSLATAAVAQDWAEYPTVAMTGDKFPLSKADIAHLMLTEGASTGGRRLQFRAHDPQILQTSWPLVWRNPEFDVARKGFETTRDLALHEFAIQRRLE